MAKRTNWRMMKCHQDSGALAMVSSGGSTVRVQDWLSEPSPMLWRPGAASFHPLTLFSGSLFRVSLRAQW
jgi:hypothetical protein